MAIGGAGGHQFVVGAVADQAAIFHEQDLVGAADLREAVGDQQRGAPFEDTTHGALDLIFGVAVDRAGRVVEHQDAWIAEKGAGDGDALTLATGEHHPAFADDGVVALRKAHDKVVSLRFLGGLFDLCLAYRFAGTKGDILGNRTREEKDILLNRRDLRAQAVHAPFTHINTIDQYLASGRIKGTVQQFGQRALARPRLPDNGNGLPRFGVKGDIL